LADIAIERIDMPTRNVVITGHQADMIERLVESGEYQNASEVLREGLRLVEEREDERQAKLSALREAAKIGFEAIDRGDYRDFDTPEELREHLASLAQEVLSEHRG
jgi:antitoxin ParD1/3/4